MFALPNRNHRNSFSSTWRAVLLHGVLALAPLGLTAQSPALAQPLPDFVDIYERQGPAVVSISVSATVGGNRRGGNSGPDMEGMEEFFRRFGIPMPRGDNRNDRNDRNDRSDRGNNNERERTVPRGSGSGFLISADGFIVTNHHVVEKADEVTVKTTDKREFKAKVVGSDQRTDTALLKIEATGMPFLRIGDPSKLKVGEWIVAIGQPFGLENTLTKGVVSAKGRNSLGDSNNLVSFIQHDAAVNPGNSGGPLFNLRGEVVGVNSMIFTRSGGFQGLSFAIPIDQAMDVVKQLQASGKIQRGKIGVTIGPVSRDVAEAFGLSKAQGALVQGVEKDSAAEKAGIKPDDIILKFDGKPVLESSDLPRIVTSIKPGSRAVAEVWRGGKARDITLTLGEFKDESVAAARTPDRAKAEAEKSKSSKLSRLDISVSPMSEEDRKEADVKSGVRIEEIRKGVRSLEVDDIILAVTHKGNTSEIATPDQLSSALAKVDKGGTVAFRIKRKNSTATVTEKLTD